MRHAIDKAIILRSERFVQLSPLTNKALRIEENDAKKKIVYEAQIACEKFYYGAECAIFCQPNIASFHFYCSPDGERLCEKGWSGQNCDDPICAKGCGNGICIAPNMCRCRNGWRGELCDRCRVLEGCKHGYCKQANECICEKNWGGTFCDRDLDYCYHNSPCQNGGKCSSGGLQNYYYCNCTSGYTGQNCELKVDPCTQVDCGKFGRCTMSGESVECRCDSRHYGVRCQYSVEEVDANEKILALPICALIESVCFKHCALIRDGDCLKNPCVFPRGQCLSWAQLNKETSKAVCRQRILDGRRNTFGCASMLAEFDLNILPKVRFNVSFLLNTVIVSEWF
ncbi:unnamed protein product [Toxocara canis]|uniref:Delta-like protein n=1 Tax=Toxocara canis TaxID=6265 RepID=A0A183UTK9_TOXCA|nr:unnamed protein product [Toxocara canis]